jgi:hypothetical protein
MLVFCGEAYKQIPTINVVSAMLPDPDSINSILEPYVQPWYDSIQNPQKAQEKVLVDLLSKYAITEYGAKNNATKIPSINDYQANFPIINYAGLTPHLKAVREGSYKLFYLNHPKPGL